MANSASHAALPYPIKGARFTLLVPYLDADGDPTDPTTPDSEVSKDGAAFADCAEEVSTITGSNGVGYLTLSGAETDASMVALAFKVASGPKATLATLYPKKLVSITTGTLAAGSAGGGTLASAIAYDLAGCIIKTTGGTGGGGTGGADNQARKIDTYTPSTGAFTVVPNWETVPDTTTTYDVMLPEGVTLGMLRALNPTTAGRTLDVSAGGEAGIDWNNIGSPTTAQNLSGTNIDPDQVVASVTGAVGSVTGAVGSVTGAVGSVAGLTPATVHADLDDIQARLPAALVGGRMDATIDATGMEAGAVDAIWDEVMEGAVTARQSMRLQNSGSGGKLSGAATTNVLVRDLGDTKNRIDATVDADGNRTAVTLDLA